MFLSDTHVSQPVSQSARGDGPVFQILHFISHAYIHKAHMVYASRAPVRRETCGRKRSCDRWYDSGRSARKKEIPADVPGRAAKEERKMKHGNFVQVTLEETGPVQAMPALERYSKTNSGPCRLRTAFSLIEMARGQACRRAYSRRAAGPRRAGTALHGSGGRAGTGIGVKGTDSRMISGIAAMKPIDRISKAGDAG